MKAIISTLVEYLKKVFLEGTQGLLTLVDIFGIILLLSPLIAPNISENLIDIEKKTGTMRIIGIIILVASYTWANFNVYRKLSEEISYKADVRITVDEYNFSHSRGTQESPYDSISKSPRGFNKQGLPYWGSMFAGLRFANIGHESGTPIMEFDSKKSKLPPLFNCEEPITSIYIPQNIESRKEKFANLFFYVTFSENEPHEFARALKRTVKSNKHYKIIYRYWTKRFDGVTPDRKLVIEGDFISFYESVLKYWESYGYSELADIARLG